MSTAAVCSCVSGDWKRGCTVYKSSESHMQRALPVPRGLEHCQCSNSGYISSQMYLGVYYVVEFGSEHHMLKCER